MPHTQHQRERHTVYFSFGLESHNMVEFEEEKILNCTMKYQYKLEDTLKSDTKMCNDGVL